MLQPIPSPDFPELELDRAKELFGMRSLNILLLSKLNIPIVPGFAIDSGNVLENKTQDLEIKDLERELERMSSLTGKPFRGGGGGLPMFLKVIVSPSIQIGTIRSVHTVGINDVTVAEFAQFCGEDFAYHEYRYFINSVGKRFLGVDAKKIEEVENRLKGSSYKEICEALRAEVVPDFPQDICEQLIIILKGLNNQYNDDPINEDIEGSLLVQMMVYGNSGDSSYSGRLTSRDPIDGSKKVGGYFGHNVFDITEDTGMPIEQLDSQYLSELSAMADLLERHFKDIREVKFVVENGRIWVIEQGGVDAKSTQAELKTLIDLHSEGVLNKADMIKAIPPAQLNDLLQPMIEQKSLEDKVRVSGGIAGSPGAAVGMVALSTNALLLKHQELLLSNRHPMLILAMPHTDAEDVVALELGVGCIASVGGYASHAPVVSRSLRKPCLVNQNIKFYSDYMEIDGQKIREFETISIDVPTYSDPSIWIGEANLIFPSVSLNGVEDFMRLLSDEKASFNLYSAASSVKFVEQSLLNGATGVGKLSMDDLILDDDIYETFCRAIAIPSADLRREYFRKVEDLLAEKLLQVFLVAGERRVDVELLSASLMEHLPHDATEQQVLFESLVAEDSSITPASIVARCNLLKNVNPVLGVRGARLFVTQHDILEMLVRSLFKAAYRQREQKGQAVDLGILIPNVMSDAEVRFIAYGRNIEGEYIAGIHAIHSEISKEHQDKSINFRIGASIELPVAAMHAGHFAKQTQFILIELDKLTQSAYGISSEDANMFLPSYTQFDILRENPLGGITQSMSAMVGEAILYAQCIRPDIEIGVCGKAAVDPANAELVSKLNVDYVVAGVLDAPVVRLASIQKYAKK